MSLFIYGLLVGLVVGFGIADAIYRNTLACRRTAGIDNIVGRRDAAKGTR